MNECADIRAQMGFYLDEELHGGERTAIENHLRNCGSCREIFDTERAFLKAIQDSYPHYIAPPKLRAKATKILSEAPSPYKAPAALRSRLQRSFEELRIGRFHLPNGRWAIVAAILLLVMAAGLEKFTPSTKQSENLQKDFPAMAVDLHQRHLQGQLPLDLTTDQPEKISAWFTGKLPFKLELPNYQDNSGRKKPYAIEGARLANYRNAAAAYVVYRMGRQNISLLVTSRAVAEPSGGEEIVANQIAFHHDSIAGLKIITWSHRGLTYALVSDLDSPGQQSCMVCHEGTSAPLEKQRPNT